ncbi:hypothetical protein KDD30_05285 [Photobacterium sp. GJ3]|uniref:tetratricopeptide repeat protein n=1 Tax=Photobacterium sp. GJ3 TaxID=2829502 RepID=UPI001B8BC618|nr:hypothetical protein [Photobacterium sp. GJ3]QUJ68529.1 hypothetical protein KDD30_05285 [Photobacterium sp. GJ3]
MDHQLSYQEILRLAVHAVQSKDFVTALQLCKSVDRDQMPDQSLNLIHAAILNQIGMFSESVEIYQIVIENDPENQLAQFQLGIAYFWRGDFSEAEKLWDALPYFAHFTTALLEAKRKNYAEAVRSLKAFMAENTDYPDLNLDAFNLAEQFQTLIPEVKANESVSVESVPVASKSVDTAADAMVRKPAQDETATRFNMEDRPKDVPATSLKDVNALLSIYKDD